MSVSLIVSIYHSQADLPLLLSALSQQSKVPDEIIFAEDDISNDTVEILREGKKRYPHLKMKLVQHEDRGFRKAEIANKAVSIARNDKLVFLDGDCLPHRHYVKVYAECKAREAVYSAPRVVSRRRGWVQTASDDIRPQAC
jgi:cellulose synthase/poly-beta-1,6-N-acetylglucosamine synthase-like glycosyltransferase